jgi:hypothetical protein
MELALALIAAVMVTVGVVAVMKKVVAAGVVFFAVALLALAGGASHVVA